MFQAVTENNSISNSEPEVGLAQDVMDLAVSPKLADLEEMFLMGMSARTVTLHPTTTLDIA